MKRKASPSPKARASAYFSDSENGDSDDSSRRTSASTPSSLSPDKTGFTKPPRATPDHRRGLRSPNPSPLSPRSRVPTDGGLSPHLTSDYEQGELRGPDIGDRWAPQGTQDGDALRSANGNPYPDISRRESREEFVNHRQKRYKEAPPASRDDDRWSSGRDLQDWKSAGMPRSQVVGMDADRETHGRDGEPVHRNRRPGGEADRVEHHRNGGRMEGRRHGGRNAEYVTGSRDSGRNGEHLRGFTRDGGRRMVDREAANGDGDVRHRQQQEAASEFPAAGPTEKVEPPEEIKVARQRPVLPLGRSGGVYVPPFKLAQMMKDMDDKSSPEYQRLTWDALRKSINGLVNKVNGSNLKNILPELFSENLIRGRGLFARSCMKSQMASPGFTHIFAALVAVVNTKFPELGELLLKRIILQLRRAFKRKDKPVLLAAAKFIAHLVNQQVAHEILALELLTVLLEKPTDDSVEVAVGFVKECGSVLQNLSPQGLHGIFERFRGILHEGDIDKRVQFMIEGLFALRKAKFQGFAGVLPELDLVEEQDQITHDLDLNDEFDDESYLDVFKVDPNFAENEQKYEIIKKEILGDESEEEGLEDGEGGSDEDDSDEEEEEDEDELEQRLQIQDETETNLVNLRRTIYLTIMSSIDFEEAGHKLLKIKLEPGQEMELCVMLLECCSQERTYLRYYGLLGQRFCLINRVYQENFDQCFVKQYSMIHRLETNKLRNVAKFFAHLLGTDALPWQALAYIRLTEEDTTSSSRIFIKILFQELSEHLGLRRLNERLSDPMMQDSFDGIFPKDNPKNTRFAINFFTSIGLGGLTDSLREYLKNMPRLIMQHPPVLSDKEISDASSSDTSSGPDSSDSESSETDSSDAGSSSDDSDTSEDERKQRMKKKSRSKR